MYDEKGTSHRAERRGCDITELADGCDRLEGIYKQDLLPGDRVVVATRNSVYSLNALGGHFFTVAGGWFEALGGELVVRLNGCTFGGHAIHEKMVAAPGLFLEFGNGVKTSQIVEVRLVRQGGAPLLN
ncbi:MAG TPA: hypothetical protein VMT16_00195 [Thermoanaerobaculia bacterium]|nr:hypothetical protein [Thermoanaerobaculia bacterium]